MTETKNGTVEAEILRIEEVPPSALEALTRAEIDVQVATAKKYPRQVSRFVDDCTKLATLNEEVAGSCIYALPRGGKTIEGPSVRLAEILVSSWGNCACETRITGDDGKFLTAQATFRDLERNTAIRVEVQRRVTDKKGTRYKDDMIAVTANAAASIAFRNAVFKGIPKSFWEPIYAECRRAVVGDVQTFQQRLDKMRKHFNTLGVTDEMICSVLDRRAVADIEPEDIVTLRGIATAIKDGDTTVEQAFRKASQTDSEEAAKDLARKLKEGDDDEDTSLPFEPPKGKVNEHGEVVPEDQS